MATSSSAKQRLLRDFKKLTTDPPAGVNAMPVSEEYVSG